MNRHTFLNRTDFMVLLVAATLAAMASDRSQATFGQEGSQSEKATEKGPPSAVANDPGSGKPSHAESQPSKQPSEPPTVPPRSRAELESHLEEIDQVDFSDVPLRDLLDAYGAQAGIQFVLDRQSLDEEGIGEDQAISVRLSNIRRSQFLQIALEPLGLTWIVEDGYIRVTTLTRAEEQMEIRVYQVADLLEQRPVPPPSYLPGVMGMPGMMPVPGMSGMPGMMPGGTSGSMIAPGYAPRPNLGSPYGVPQPTLPANPAPANPAPANPAPANNAPAGGSSGGGGGFFGVPSATHGTGPSNTILAQFGGGIGGGLGGAGGYGGGLGGMGGGGGGGEMGSGAVGGSPGGSSQLGGPSSQLDFESLTDLVQATVAPDSWVDAGGSASIRAYHGGVLVIGQSVPVHRRLQRFFDMLREARAAESGAVVTE